jgi:transcriptional regulator with XRE-family HTH domain
MTLNPNAIGRTLGEIRRAKGLTQREVASQTGLTVNYLSLLENGQRGPSMDVVNKLANALRVPAEFILFLAGDGISASKAGDYRELFKATKDAILELIQIDTKTAK